MNRENIPHILREIGLPTIRVIGHSMEPTFCHGDHVTLQNREARTGDVVVYMRGGEFFIHRLVAKSKDLFFTMGDNCTVPDIPVKRTEIIGVVKENRPSRYKTFTMLIRAVYFWIKIKAKQILMAVV